MYIHIFYEKKMITFIIFLNMKNKAIFLKYYLYAIKIKLVVHQVIFFINIFESKYYNKFMFFVVSLKKYVTLLKYFVYNITIDIVTV